MTRALDPAGLQLVGRLQRLVHGDAGADEADGVLVGGAEDAAAADLELLVRAVEHGRRRPQRADVGDAFHVSHRRDKLRRLVRVARVKDGRAVHRAEGGDVLESHLRRPVLADRDARVRAGHGERRPADRRHADEVVGAREERGEARRERAPAARLEADGRSEHLLLGDVHLEVSLRVRLLEDLGERRVRHLTVDRDDVAAG